MRPPTSRYARVGDTLQLEVRNETGAVHPFHLHGFSMQPVAMKMNDGTLLYTYDYDEFLDSDVSLEVISNVKQDPAKTNGEKNEKTQ